MLSDSDLYEPRTNAEQSETRDDFRVSYESDADCHLYFIRVKDGPVKIGRAKDVRVRLGTLQTASPYELEIVGVVKGGGFYEGSFHGMLQDHHLRGEWFNWAGLVIEAVEAALTTGKWRTVFGFNEPEEWTEEDWRDGSPLYEPVVVSITPKQEGPK